MNCQHCGKAFSDISEFEIHAAWHTERQTRLQRGHVRRYSVGKRPRSASTNRSPSVRSDVSTPNAPGSTTSQDSPSSPPRRSQHDQSPVIINDSSTTSSFDFNFGSISPIRPSSKLPALPAIRKLDDVLARFPAFEIERTHDKSHISRDFKCADCDASFSTQKDCDIHNQSRYCPGSAAVAYALYRDPHQLGGYRIDKKNLPFNAYQSTLKCSQCPLTFANRLLKRVHERSHVDPRLECLHCDKACCTANELEAHYQWHDDMEYRHHRDRYRRKLPGLKLQSTATTAGQNRSSMVDLGRKSVFLAEEGLNGGSENAGIDKKDQGNTFDQEEDLVAISFISPEDLERIHAPNGVLRETGSDPLDPHNDGLLAPVANALDALEGRSSSSQASSSSTSPNSAPDKEDRSVAKNDHSNAKVKSGPNKPSLRSFFRRTKSETTNDANLKKRGSMRRGYTRDSTSDETFAFDGRSVLNAVLQRVSTAANKGDMKAIRKECDRLLAIKPPTTTSSQGDAVPVKAFSFPEGTLILDAAGQQRYISSQVVQDITSGLRRLPAATLAKSKVSVLSTRAYLSTQDADFADAFWCYRAVMELLRQYPMLFPDVIWQAAIFSNLAHLAARLDRRDDEERYYLKALGISYNRYGRKDLNNIHFLRALAAAYETNDSIAQAAEVYKRSLFARMEISGPGDNDTLMAMQDLAAIYFRLGRLLAAKLLYEQCLGGFEVQLGLGHKVTLLIVDRLCEVYVQQEQYDEALAFYLRAFPHLLGNFSLGDDLPRNWIARWVQHTPNFDFPPAVSEYLQSYRIHPNSVNLDVLQSLAQAYMQAGLVADAADTFHFVYQARVRLEREENPPSVQVLDALHGHCRALESMDDLDAAHSAYLNLIQLCLRSHDKADGRSRAMRLTKRLTALQDRKKVLAGEQEAWEVGPTANGPCQTCRFPTTILCRRCNITRFCCEACRDLGSRAHDPACHPSVTLCQSRSVTAAPGVPSRIEREVLDRLSQQDLRRSGKATLHRVTDTFTLSFDRRNFTTFRVKFNSAVDTFISFDRSADIRFAMMDPSDEVVFSSSPTSGGTGGDGGLLPSGAGDHEHHTSAALDQLIVANPASSPTSTSSPVLTQPPASSSSSSSSPPSTLSRKNSIRQPTLATVLEDDTSESDHDEAATPSTSSQHRSPLSSTSPIHPYSDDDNVGSPQNPPRHPSQTKSKKNTVMPINRPNKPFHWTTPRETESLLIHRDSRRGGGVYLFVAPGLTMFQEMLDQRRRIRRADSAALQGYDVRPERSPIASSATVDVAPISSQGLDAEASGWESNLDSGHGQGSNSAPPSMTIANAVSSRQHPGLVGGDVPNEVMVQYAQALPLEGTERTRFAYLVEVES